MFQRKICGDICKVNTDKLFIKNVKNARVKQKILLYMYYIYYTVFFIYYVHFSNFLGNNLFIVINISNDPDCTYVTQRSVS